MRIKKLIKIMAVVYFGFIGCGKKNDNVLLKDFDTPYGVPPFDKIKVEDYEPAFDVAIREYHKNVQNIVDNKEVPNFKNTIENLEFSDKLLKKISEIYYPQLSANGTKELRAISKKISPMITKAYDEVILNSELFEKIKSVYEQKDTLNLSIEENTLLEKTYKKFANNGSSLNETDKEKLKKINAQLSVLSIQFGENIQNEENEFEILITDEKELSGLPQWLVKSGEETAKNKGKQGYIYTLHRTISTPFLTYADNRELRKKMFLGYSLKGNNNDKNDNKKIILEIIQLRNEKIKLLGYQDYTEFVLQNSMAKNKENVFKLLDEVWKPAIRVAKEEAKNLQDIIDKNGENFKLEPWDWWYYTEKLKKEKYSLDSEELKSYFPLKEVTKGVFHVANKLYGLNFEDITKDVPTFNKDIYTYKVTDNSGNYIGLLLTDFYTRDTKKNGAWMTSYRKQSTTENGEFVHPIISITCNFTKPIGDKPALLSIDEVRTYFHEFGHATHGLLSQCKYNSLSGTAVPRDFVELPSQILENWSVYPEVLEYYAKHYETGEKIPQELIDKMKELGTFNSGFENIEYLAAATLDMYWHTEKDITPDTDVNKFEETMMNKLGLTNEIIPRYRSTYFNHIFAGGYAVGYYSYKWSEILDADAFHAFVETGDIYNPDVANKFKENVLKKGGTEDPMTLYKKFRGNEPTTGAMLKRSGLM